MSRMQNLEQAVTNLYAAKNPNRADWADWLGANHVFVVADYASEIAKRYGADEELARAGGLLHDIADATMSRFTPGHEATSLAIARELMHDAGFADKEINLTVDDAIRLHSCHDGNMPDSLEGKVLATADAKAHLLSDFYLFATWSFGKEDKSLEDAKAYTLKKIERDFHNKILFDDVREECHAAYAELRAVFNRK
ncbi:MAG TPA: HD domain-containing protein [Candidatus Saccharimonadales bacterium]|nr:HD domain-containing protein [Candidatus Saccharimonadales bacterium]